MPIMEIMMVGGMLVGAGLSGVSDAQKQCQNVNTISDLTKQMQQLATSNLLAINNFKKLDNLLQQQIGNVSTSLQESVTGVILSKRDYAIFIKQSQLTCACIIIVVFLLLLAKKLNIY